MYLNSSEYPCTAGSIITTSTNKQTNKQIHHGYRKLQFTMSFQALPGDNSLNISMRLARCDVYIIFEFAADWVAGNKMKVGEIEVDA